MAKTFYQYLMTHRNSEGKSELAIFANHAYLDHSFPKRSSDYQEISQYLELNGDYLPSMRIFARRMIKTLYQSGVQPCLPSVASGITAATSTLLMDLFIGLKQREHSVLLVVYDRIGQS